MEVIEQVETLRKTLTKLRTEKDKVAQVGFVPTMGYLHEGHMSLIEKAKAQCDIVVLSIYVNPLQFGPTEDLATYPRDLQRDVDIAKQLGVDVVFAPSDAEMYPRAIKSRVTVSGVSDVLCGASRPGHFDGVATVVMKLLHIVQPERVYFGMKDAQQIAVIKQVVHDLNVNVEVVACETMREDDGLAKSSRNVYLSEEERKQAVVLYEALQLAERLIEEQPHLPIAEWRQRIEAHIVTAPLAVIDYVQVLTYPALEAIQEDADIASVVKAESVIIALAVKFGTTRLIDNRVLGGETHV